jgi:hypothetical protein
MGIEHVRGPLRRGLRFRLALLLASSSVLVAVLELVAFASDDGASNANEYVSGAGWVALGISVLAGVAACLLARGDGRSWIRATAWGAAMALGSWLVATAAVLVVGVAAGLIRLAALLVVILLLWIGPSYLVGRLAGRKGRSFGMFFAAALVLFWPLVLLFALVIPARRYSPT